MYLPEGYIGTSTTWGWVERLSTYLASVFQGLKQLVFGVSRWIVDGSSLVGEPLSRTCWPFPGAIAWFAPVLWLNEVIIQPSEWVKMVFSATVDLVHAHLFLAHILAWSIFFGPIIVLIPFLLIHEIFILVAYNLTYVLHGLLPGSLPEQYEALRLSLLDTRESLFSFIDRSSSVFNKWTAEHMPLMVLRLAGGAFGSLLLYAIWAGW